MKHTSAYLLVCIGLLSSYTPLHAMKPDLPPIPETTVSEEDASSVEAQASTPAHAEGRPAVALHQTEAAPKVTPFGLPVITEEPAGTDVDVTKKSAGPTVSDKKPPLPPRARGHRRTCAVDLGRHTATKKRIDNRPRLVLQVNNSLPRVTLRMTYSSLMPPKGVPPLSPIKKERSFGSGSVRFHIPHITIRGQGVLQQTLSLTKIEFIDTDTNTVIKTIDAEALRHPETLGIITLDATMNKGKEVLPPSEPGDQKDE